MKNIAEVIAAVEKTIKELRSDRTPVELFEPYHYIMELGGKRIRPLLVLWGYYLFRDDWQNALKPAVAVEVFHNFTLVHDDVMDNAPLRRGKPTVHEKWDTNVAVLSGDLMLIESYALLLQFPFVNLSEVMKQFSVCAADVCRGQQFDMNFPKVARVTREDYLEMIRLKTAVLPAFCLQLGAFAAEADDQNARLLYETGEAVGIAFQIKDDYLDAFGDAETFGKQAGGDILENKKTILYILAYESDDAARKDAFDAAFALQGEEKVRRVTELFRLYEIDKIALDIAERYFERAFSLLNSLQISQDKKKLFEGFLKGIKERNV
jgi:geranylgeranyl diphosphate synthase type II